MRAVLSVLALVAAFTAGMRYAQTCPTPEPYDPPLMPTHVPAAPTDLPIQPFPRQPYMYLPIAASRVSTESVSDGSSVQPT
jgi:hypothetical protein